MPNISGMLLKRQGFQYDMSLDLSTGYYHIQLLDNASNLCTIIIPWGKYCYKRLPTGFEISPDIFQQKMNDLFYGFDFICAHIDKLLLIIKVDRVDHASKLELTLSKLKKGLACNIENSFFGKTEMEYLGFKKCK